MQGQTVEIIAHLMSYSCPGGPASPGTTRSGSPRCPQRWQSSRCGCRGRSCACSWNLPACWCWSKSPGSGLFWAQVICCEISSRSRNTPVAPDHAPRPPSARKSAGALIYACGDSRFSAHLHSSAARLLGSPWPRQTWWILEERNLRESISVQELSPLIQRNYIARPPRVHVWVSSKRVKVRADQNQPTHGLNLRWHDEHQQLQENPRTERAQRPPLPALPAAQPRGTTESKRGAPLQLEDVSSTCLRFAHRLYPPLRSCRGWRQDFRYMLSK